MIVQMKVIPSDVVSSLSDSRSSSHTLSERARRACDQNMICVFETPTRKVRPKSSSYISQQHLEVSLEGEGEGEGERGYGTFARRYRLDRHFRLAARMTDKIYLPMRSTQAVSCRGSSDAIPVDVADFRRALDAALRLARSFDDGVSECGLKRRPTTTLGGKTSREVF